MTRRAFGSGRRGGFTLIEVLLAIALVSVLAGSIFAFLMEILSRRTMLRDLAGDAGAGVRLLDRIEDDLQTAIAGGGGLAAGIVGDTDELEVLSLGVPTPGDGDASRPGGGDLLRTRLRWDAATGRLMAARAAVDAAREGGDAAARAGLGVPAGSMSDGAGGGADEEVLSERVAWLQFRYFDGRSWVGSFDSVARRRLPPAVEVAVWFGEPPRGGDEPAGGTPPEAAGAGRGVAGVSEPLADGEAVALVPPARAPDRVRIIAIPDASEAMGAAEAEADGQGPGGGA